MRQLVAGFVFLAFVAPRPSAAQDGEPAEAVAPTTDGTVVGGEGGAALGGAVPSGQDGDPPVSVVIESLDIKFFEEVAGGLVARPAWLPIYVEMALASGPSRKVQVEATVSASIGPRERNVFRARREIEVTPGAPTRAWLYVRVDPTESSQSVHLAVQTPGGAQAANRSWPIFGSGAASRRQISILVVGDILGDASPWPGDLVFDQIRGRRVPAGLGREVISRTVDTAAPRALPDNVLGYDTIDLLVLRELPKESLEPAQIQAIVDWVHLGGTVVALPQDSSGNLFRHPVLMALVGDVLVQPRLEESFQPGYVRVVDAVGRGNVFPESRTVPAASEPPQETCFRVDPISEALSERADVREIFSVDSLTTPAADGARLYLELPVGRGAVGFFTLDARNLGRSRAAIQFIHSVWRPIVRWRCEQATSPVQEQWASAASNALATTLRDPSRDIGLPFIIGLVIAYLLLVGPGLYFYLKRKNRLLALVWLEPLIAFVYVGVVFGTGYLSKGVLTKTRLWTLVQQVSGESSVLRQSYLSIFAGDEGEYRIAAPRGQLLVPVGANDREARELRPTLVTGAHRGARIEDYHLKLWQQGYVVNTEFTRSDTDGVEVAFGDGDSGGTVARVTNHLASAIHSGYLFYDPSGRQLAQPIVVPAIEVGGAVEVSLVVPAGTVPEESTEAAEWALALQRVKALARFGYGARGNLWFVGRLERNVVDFQIDRPTSTKARQDLFLFFRSGS